MKKSAPPFTNVSLAKMIGSKVKNFEGEDLGKIEDILFDLQSGHITFAILSLGGILGLGDKLFAIPWEALGLDHEDKVVMNIDKTLLEKAEPLDKNNTSLTFDRGWAQRIYDYYGYKNHKCLNNS